MNKNDFNPNEIGIPNGNYFGFPYSPEESKVLYLPVPWDVTTSYGAGTHKGPQAILDASIQLDFFDPDVNNAWKIGHGTLPLNVNTLNENSIHRAEAESVIQHLENGGSADDDFISKKIENVNNASRELNKYVYSQTSKWLEYDKLIGLVGGDHSIPYGFLQALSEKHDEFGILQIDAHADLRNAYEGFDYSHASIMFNALKIDSVKKLVQVGIRDFCEEEAVLARKDKRIKMFTDAELNEAEFEGKTWIRVTKDIIKNLPKKVYISFDIDGLNQQFCPNTGTPVPGGLSYAQAIFLIKTIAESGRKIIGFDICEVAPGTDEWDANVGARLLYKISNLMYLSNSK